MTTERIKEIQEKTAYPDSISVQQALFQVWNECEQEPRVDDKDEWISVKNSMPGLNPHGLCETILVCGELGLVETGYMIDAEFRDTNHRKIKDPITHWRNLPKRPKK